MSSHNPAGFGGFGDEWDDDGHDTAFSTFAHSGNANVLKPVAFVSSGIMPAKLSAETTEESTTTPTIPAQPSSNSIVSLSSARPDDIALHSLPTSFSSKAIKPKPKLDKDFASFVKTGTGFGLRLLQKMGFRGALGRNEDGVSNPIEVQVRPRNAGLGSIAEVKNPELNPALRAEEERKAREEEEQRRLAKLLKRAEKSAWKKGTTRPTAVKTLAQVKAELVAKLGEDGARAALGEMGLEQGGTGKGAAADEEMVVYDMRGKAIKLKDIGDVLTTDDDKDIFFTKDEVESDTDDAYDQDTVHLPELKYNLKHLVSRMQRLVLASERRVHQCEHAATAARNRAAQLRKEEASLDLHSVELGLVRVSVGRAREVVRACEEGCKALEKQVKREMGRGMGILGHVPRYMTTLSAGVEGSGNGGGGGSLPDTGTNVDSSIRTGMGAAVGMGLDDDSESDSEWQALQQKQRQLKQSKAAKEGKGEQGVSKYKYHGSSRDTVKKSSTGAGAGVGAGGNVVDVEAMTDGDGVGSSGNSGNTGNSGSVDQSGTASSTGPGISTASVGGITACVSGDELRIVQPLLPHPVFMYTSAQYMVLVLQLQAIRAVRECVDTLCFSHGAIFSRMGFVSMITDVVFPMLRRCMRMCPELGSQEYTQNSELLSEFWDKLQLMAGGKAGDDNGDVSTSTSASTRATSPFTVTYSYPLPTPHNPYPLPRGYVSLNTHPLTPILAVVTHELKEWAYLLILAERDHEGPKYEIVSRKNIEENTSGKIHFSGANFSRLLPSFATILRLNTDIALSELIESHVTTLFSQWKPLQIPVPALCVPAFAWLWLSRGALPAARVQAMVNTVVLPRVTALLQQIKLVRGDDGASGGSSSGSRSHRDRDRHTSSSTSTSTSTSTYSSTSTSTSASSPPSIAALLYPLCLPSLFLPAPTSSSYASSSHSSLESLLSQTQLRTLLRDVAAKLTSLASSHSQRTSTSGLTQHAAALQHLLMPLYHLTHTALDLTILFPNTPRSTLMLATGTAPDLRLLVPSPVISASWYHALVAKTAAPVLVALVQRVLKKPEWSLRLADAFTAVQAWAACADARALCLAAWPGVRALVVGVLRCCVCVVHRCGVQVLSEDGQQVLAVDDSDGGDGSIGEGGDVVGGVSYTSAANTSSSSSTSSFALNGVYVAAGWWSHCTDALPVSVTRLPHVHALITAVHAVLNATHDIAVAAATSARADAPVTGGASATSAGVGTPAPSVANTGLSSTVHPVNTNTADTDATVPQWSALTSAFTSALWAAAHALSDASAQTRTVPVSSAPALSSLPRTAPGPAPTHAAAGARADAFAQAGESAKCGACGLVPPCFCDDIGVQMTPEQWRRFRAILSGTSITQLSLLCAVAEAKGVFVHRQAETALSGAVVVMLDDLPCRVVEDELYLRRTPTHAEVQTTGGKDEEWVWTPLADVLRRVCM